MRKQLASRLSAKWGRKYSQVCGYLRSRLAIVALVSRASTTTQCLRGTRDPTRALSLTTFGSPFPKFFFWIFLLFLLSSNSRLSSTTEPYYRSLTRPASTWTVITMAQKLVIIVLRSKVRVDVRLYVFEAGSLLIVIWWPNTGMTSILSCLFRPASSCSCVLLSLAFANVTPELVVFHRVQFNSIQFSTVDLFLFVRLWLLLACLFVHTTEKEARDKILAAETIETAEQIIFCRNYRSSLFNPFLFCTVLYCTVLYSTSCNSALHAGSRHLSAGEWRCNGRERPAPVFRQHWPRPGSKPPQPSDPRLSFPPKSPPRFQFDIDRSTIDFDSPPDGVSICYSETQTCYCRFRFCRLSWVRFFHFSFQWSDSRGRPRPWRDILFETRRKAQSRRPARPQRIVPRRESSLGRRGCGHKRAEILGIDRHPGRFERGAVDEWMGVFVQKWCGISLLSLWQNFVMVCRKLWQRLLSM